MPQERHGNEIEAFVQVPTLIIIRCRPKFINRLVWGIYRDLTIQDGKSLSMSCLNVFHLWCSKD